jgi:ATP-dependent DNA helicase RecQ
MLYSPKDKGLQAYFIQSSEAPQEIKSARWRNLDALVNYSETGECRHGEILTYYRDAQRIGQCGHCDNCDPHSVRRIQKTVALPSLAKARKETHETGSTKLRKKKTDLVIHELDEIQELRFQRLRQWRKQKSVELDTPAFTVFSDKTLRHLAIANPSSETQLRNIYGIGEEKLSRYGVAVLAILQSPE